MIAIKPQYITDNQGKKISAILPIKQFRALLDNLEELEDIRLYDESKKDGDPALSKDTAMKLLKEEREKLRN